MPRVKGLWRQRALGLRFRVSSIADTQMEKKMETEMEIEVK